MKSHVLLWSIGRILEEDQDRAELLYGYTVTRTIEKAGLYIVFTNLQLFI